jgi:hypothetical protein
MANDLNDEEQAAINPKRSDRSATARRLETDPLQQEKGSTNE